MSLPQLSRRETLGGLAATSALPFVSGSAAAARVAPAGARIGVSSGSDSVRVTVSSAVPILGGHVPLLIVRATAVAAREPESVLP